MNPSAAAAAAAATASWQVVAAVTAVGRDAARDSDRRRAKDAKGATARASATGTDSCRKQSAASPRAAPQGYQQCVSISLAEISARSWCRGMTGRPSTSK